MSPSTARLETYRILRRPRDDQTALEWYRYLSDRRRLAQGLLDDITALTSAAVLEMYDPARFGSSTAKMTAPEIAAELGITKARVMQIVRRAERQLAKSTGS